MRTSWTVILVSSLLAGAAFAADAVGADCEPDRATSRSVNVTLDPLEGIRIAGVVVSLRYPADKVTIPGRGPDVPSGTVTNTPAGAFAASFDAQGEFRQVIARAEELAPGRLFTVRFAGCREAEPAVAGDFACVVTDASDDKTTQVEGARCRVLLD
jgi:hypothetical protein